MRGSIGEEVRTGRLVGVGSTGAVRSPLTAMATCGMPAHDTHDTHPTAIPRNGVTLSCFDALLIVVSTEHLTAGVGCQDRCVILPHVGLKLQ